MRRLCTTALALLAALAPAGCSKPADTSETSTTSETGIKADKGVDLDRKIIYIGALNDESGPAAVVGKPYAIGKRLLAAAVNAGGSGLLPDGWTIELVERDHGYNPQQAVQQYNAIKDRVLFIGTSFGTPNTLPLLPMIERDRLVVFPASLASEMEKNERTPPLDASYRLEAMRAMDWAVEHAGGAAQLKAGIIYQHDDYGKDGLDGWSAAASHHGVTVVASQAIAPGQKDVTAAITALMTAGATHVLLTTLPSATGPILGTAAQLRYNPIWIGNTPSWIDRFFDPKVIPPAVFASYHWVSGLAYWGEERPGMAAFLEAYEKHGRAMGEPDFYILSSYVQGLGQLEAARRALEAKDVTRDGFLQAVRSIDGFDAGGLGQPLTLTTLPYVTSTRVRVLKPDLENRSWQVVSGYETPKAFAR